VALVSLPPQKFMRPLYCYYHVGVASNDITSMPNFVKTSQWITSSNRGHTAWWSHRPAFLSYDRTV